MVMTALTLAEDLAAMELFGSEPEAIAAWALVYRTFFADAVCAGIPAVPVGLDPAELAMRGSMTGLSVTGAVAIQAGVLAFWAALVPTVVFPTCTLITPPPGVATLSAALLATFAANTVGALSKADSAQAISATLFTSSSGGTGTFPGSPPLVFPVL